MKSHFPSPNHSHYTLRKIIAKRLRDKQPFVLGCSPTNTDYWLNILSLQIEDKLMLQQMIDYYEKQKDLCVRNMNKNCSEFWAFEGIKYSKILDSLYKIKEEKIFE